MKTLAIAVLSAVIGAVVALLVRDAARSPDVAPAVHEEKTVDRRELLELRSQLDQLSRELAASHATPEPARVEVANDAVEQVQELASRVDGIEQELAKLFARLDAIPQVVTLSADAGDARSAWPMDAVLRKKLEATDTRNADALVELADWATAQGLATDAKRLFRLAVKVDPENAAAREGLGYRKYNGKWMTSREIEREKAEGR